MKWLSGWLNRAFTGPEFIVSQVLDRDDHGRPTDLLVHCHEWADADDVMGSVRSDVRNYQALRVERREPQWWRASVVYQDGYSGQVA